MISRLSPKFRNEKFSLIADSRFTDDPDFSLADLEESLVRLEETLEESVERTNVNHALIAVHGSQGGCSDGNKGDVDDMEASTAMET